MKNEAPMSLMKDKSTTQINTRQLALFLAFFLPIGKLLELPSLLARYAAGDLLLPAFLGTAFEFLCFLGLFLFATQSETSLFERIEEKFGKGAMRAAYIVCALSLLLYSLLPVFDLEKYSHAVFADTEPTFFTFAPFFLFSGFVCTKGVKAIGRSADLSVLLFLFPFLGLIIMSVGQTNFSKLLPLFERPFSVSAKAVWHTLPHFSSAIFLLPLMGGYRHKKGDAKKLLPAFGVGSALFLLFLAVFFGLYGEMAEREHYAVAKIAQYFPALKTLGRVDLLLVYLLSVQLFFYTALPLQLAVDCFCKSLQRNVQTLSSAAINAALFFVVLFFNRHYDELYRFFTRRLPPVFFCFALIPPLLSCLFLRKKRQNGGGRGAMNTKKEEPNAR